MYTGSIIAELNELETKEALITYLTENIDKFSDSNVTAYETIRRLWILAAGNGGLLMQEREKLPSILDDAASGEKAGFLRRCGHEALGCLPGDSPTG